MDLNRYVDKAEARLKDTPSGGGYSLREVATGIGLTSSRKWGVGDLSSGGCVLPRRRHGNVGVIQTVLRRFWISRIWCRLRPCCTHPYYLKSVIRSGPHPVESIPASGNMLTNALVSPAAGNVAEASRGLLAARRPCHTAQRKRLQRSGSIRVASYKYSRDDVPRSCHI